MGAIRAIKLNKLFKLYATFSVAFLLSYAISGVVSPISNSSAVECVNGMISSTSDICDSDSTDVNVSIEGAWTVSISSDSNLNVNLTPTSSGVVNTATDNVNIYTNTPNGYQLYLNSTTGSTDIYNNTDTEQERNHFTATTGTKASPVSLTSNSWGYSLASSPTTFSKVEASSSASDSLISSGSKTSGTGDNLGVTYGFKADTKLTPGTYTTSVTYTAVAEVPSYTISSVSPNNFSVSDINQPITIITTTPATELGLGTITARITDSTNTNSVNLTNCTETTVTVSGTSYRAASCTYPGGLPVSINNYKVELTSSWHSATYVLNNAITIYQATMQNFTQANCTSLTESTAAEDHRTRLKDIRDGKYYNVSKLADGNCWMVQNLALDGGRTLYPNDSNVMESKTIGPNIDVNSGETDTSQVSSIDATNTDEKGNIYGNLYNWNAATATTGTLSTPAVNMSTSQSICPKNWILPNPSGNKSYLSLTSLYGFPNTETTGYKNTSKIQDAPLFFASAGRLTGNGRAEINTSGYWTNSKSTKSWGAWFLYFNLDVEQFSPQQDHLGIAYGLSVRCVFGS